MVESAVVVAAPLATQVGPASSTLNTRDTKVMVGQKYLQTSAGKSRWRKGQRSL